MSIRYLYEFNFLDIDSYTLTQGSQIQTKDRIWKGVSLVEDTDLYLNIKDNGDFPTWLSEKEVNKVFVTRYKYNTETQSDEEVVKNLYSNLSTDLNSVSLRKCDVPLTQLDDAQKLIADGIVQLFEIKLADGTYLHLKPDNSATWNNQTWTGIPILFEGYSTAQSDSYSRPTLTIANPDNVNELDGSVRSTLSSLVLPTNEYPYGLLNRSQVTRYLVLYEDLKADRLIYQKKTWIIWFIKSVNRNMIQVELRNPMDGVNFDVPARMYMPPEFPFVTLK